jgi:hypothetical protein
VASPFSAQPDDSEPTLSGCSAQPGCASCSAAEHESYCVLEGKKWANGRMGRFVFKGDALALQMEGWIQRTTRFGSHILLGERHPAGARPVRPQDQDQIIKLAFSFSLLWWWVSYEAIMAIHVRRLKTKSNGGSPNECYFFGALFRPHKLARPRSTCIGNM